MKAQGLKREQLVDFSASKYSFICGSAVLATYLFNGSFNIVFLFLFITAFFALVYFQYELGVGGYRLLKEYVVAIQLTTGAVAVALVGDLSVLLLTVPVFIALIGSKDWKVFLLPSAAALVFGGFFYSRESAMSIILSLAASLIAIYVNRNWRRLFVNAQESLASVMLFKEQSDLHLRFVRELSEQQDITSLQFAPSDKLGQALFQMGLKMQENVKQESIRNWHIQGLNELSTLLRTSQSVLSYSDLLSFIVKYIAANQGGIFVLVEDTNHEQWLELKASYAYDKHKLSNVRLSVGHGLLGQAIAERDAIYLERVPENYVHITSGLGLASPTALAIFPLAYNEKVIGALEVASFKTFAKHELEFLRRAAEIVASAVSFHQTAADTERMLEESRRLSEELKSQQEEVRQNLEELEATQEHLTREAKEREKLQEELNKSKEFLNLVLDSVPIPVFVKDRGHRMVLLNQAVCDLNNMTKEQMLGKSDYDFFSTKEADIFWNFEEEIFINKSSAEKVEHAIRNGKETYTLDKKLSVSTDDGEQFLIGINIDVTYAKLIERQMQAGLTAS